MKRTVPYVIALLIAAMTLISCGERKTMLFNGKNLDGWSFFLDPESSIPASDVFGVKDGVITISGQPYGFMVTDESFGDYEFHAEWRWIGEPTNSGLFQRVEPADKLWPHCAEVNLMAGHAGDMISAGGSAFEELKEAGTRFKTSTHPESVENPAGEWNTADIICEGAYIKVYINGVFKNEAHFDRTEGHIAIQSEGGPLEVRNVYVTPLKNRK